MIHIICW